MITKYDWWPNPCFLWERPCAQWSLEDWKPGVFLSCNDFWETITNTISFALLAIFFWNLSKVLSPRFQNVLGLFHRFEASVEGVKSVKTKQDRGFDHHQAMQHRPKLASQMGKKRQRINKTGWWGGKHGSNPNTMKVRSLKSWNKHK